MNEDVKRQMVEKYHLSFVFLQDKHRFKKYSVSMLNPPSLFCYQLRYVMHL